jgi:hypothetical protein
MKSAIRMPNIYSKTNHETNKLSSLRNLDYYVVMKIMTWVFFFLSILHFICMGGSIKIKWV